MEQISTNPQNSIGGRSGGDHRLSHIFKSQVEKAIPFGRSLIEGVSY